MFIEGKMMAVLHSTQVSRTIVTFFKTVNNNTDTRCFLTGSFIQNEESTKILFTELPEYWNTWNVHIHVWFHLTQVSLQDNDSKWNRGLTEDILNKNI